MTEQNKNNQSGVYKISFLGSSKFYIGSAVNLKKRRANHLSDLRLKKHPNNYMQNMYNKYGEDNYRFTVLEFCDVELLIIKEQSYMDELKPEINILKYATNSLGYKHTQESLLIMKQKAKARDKSVYNLSGLSLGIDACKKRTRVKNNLGTFIFDSKQEAWDFLGYKTVPGNINSKLIKNKKYMNNKRKYIMELV